MNQRTYYDIVFGNDIPVCRKCLDELKKLEVIDERVHNQKFMENTMKKLVWNSLQKDKVMYNDMMVGNKTAEVLGPEID